VVEVLRYDSAKASRLVIFQSLYYADVNSNT
jgi:hypothetical protein